MTRIGELFSGYGGLGIGVQTVYGGHVVWHSDIAPGPRKILAHRYPGIPNHGDITRVDWSTVEPVDILTGGTPCQDLSHAGKRAGMTEGTRSNLWVSMREVIAHLRPPLVVWENVKGAYSAAADSEVEPCPGCMGNGSGVSLRALGRILGDLASLGYDCRWHGLRAADVGAPHGRHRVFVTAENPNRDREKSWPSTPVPQRRSEPTLRPNRPASGHQPDPLTLLPTPVVTDMGAGMTVDQWDDWTQKMQTVHDNGNGNGKSLAIEARRPDWTDYTPALEHWADVTGRPVPPPVTDQRLSPPFVEWLMGLPAGWVTDVPGITRTEALAALGNGVVPQQAGAAIRIMHAWEGPPK